VTRPRVLAVSAVCIVSALASYLTWSATFDYSEDAGPPIDALIHGRFGDFLSARAVMGPLSLIVRAPFAALAQVTGGGDARHLYEGAFKWGIFPCMLAAGFLGLFLARIAAERRRPLRDQILIVGLCMISPPALKALQYGHPEEILGAALGVGAVVAGLRGRTGLAIVLAACAVANKQWGIFVLIPVALTLPWRDIKRGAFWVAVATVVAFVPLALADYASLHNLFRGMTDLRDTFVLPADVWWPFLHGSPDLPPHQHVMPDWLGVIGRPLLIAVCLAVPLVFARRVREDPIDRALPLLALVLLLRCMLDPLNNVYYHTPFLMALVAAGAFSRTLIPAVVATVLILLTSRLGDTNPELLAAVYLSWSLPMAVWLAGRAYGATWTLPGARLAPLKELSS
jgi:glycosyl transferase family 87